MLEQQQQPTLAVQEVDPTTMEPSIHQLTMEPSIQHLPSVEPSVHNRSSSPAPDDSEDSSMNSSRYSNTSEGDPIDSDSDSVLDLVSTSESESDICLRSFHRSFHMELTFTICVGQLTNLRNFKLSLMELIKNSNFLAKECM